MVQKASKFLIILSVAVLLSALLQTLHVQYRISKHTKVFYGVSITGPLSEPIEAIIEGDPQYIELYSICDSLNREISDTTAYCLLYVREWYNSGLPYFTSSNLEVTDDLLLCERASISISRSLLYLQEKALSFEHCKSLTNADNRWLNNTLEQVRAMDQLLLDENIPAKIDSKADVVRFLTFLKENEANFFQIHKSLVSGNSER